MSRSFRWWVWHPSDSAGWLDEIDPIASGGIDWSRVAVPPHPEWAGLVMPYPASCDVVEAAVTRLGAPRGPADRADALICVWRIIAADGRRCFEQAAGLRASAGLELVLRRADLCDELLWNYFTHQGALGVAVRNEIIETLFVTGRVVDLVASRLQSRASARSVRPGTIPAQRQVSREWRARERPRVLAARCDTVDGPPAP